MPELFNWSAMLPEFSKWSASKACRCLVFTGKLTKTSRHAITLQLVSQQSLWIFCFAESLPKPVAMPELSNWSGSKSCGVFLCGKVIKTCRHARTFQQVSRQKRVGVFFCRKFTKIYRHARTFQLVSQQGLWGCLCVESLPKPVAMPKLSNWSASKSLWECLLCGKFTKLVAMPELSNWSVMPELSNWSARKA